MSARPHATAVVVTLDRRDDLCQALDSLLAQTYAALDVIVIDNGSSDGTPAMVQEKYPDVALVELGRNTGPYHARNVGVDLARGTIVFFMDDDATASPNCVEDLVAEFEADQLLGVAVCKLIDDHTGRLDPSMYMRVPVDYDTRFYMGDMVLEGATAMRKDVFNAAGRWPAHYFRAYVGKDLSYRIIDAGYDIVYVPTAEVRHKASPFGSTTRRKIERIKVYYATRNQLWIAWKYLPVGRALSETALRLAYHFVEGVQKRALGGYFRGCMAALVSLPRILFRERQPVKPETLEKIDYLTYGGAITDRKGLETFEPIGYWSLMARKLAGFFNVGLRSKVGGE